MKSAGAPSRLGAFALPFLTAYHAGGPNSDAFPCIVYFHATDRDPLPNYTERHDRGLTNVRDFYRDSPCRNGFANIRSPNATVA